MTTPAASPPIRRWREFAYGLAWTLVFSYLPMAAIQEISARIGCVTGFGIAGNLRRHYPAWLSGDTVLLLLSSNLINLGADLGAMGAALKLLIGGPALLYVVLFRRALGRVADLHALCTASSPSSNGGCLSLLQLCDLRLRRARGMG
jgi:hypothetical protein